MKLNKIFTLMMLVFSMTLFAQTADQKSIIKDAEVAKQNFLNSHKDMQQYFDDAKAYAILPNVGKGALVVGVASGHGAVYERGQLVGTVDMKQVDVGAQIGGKAYSEIIFLRTDKAVQEFMSGKLKLAGNMSAIAVDKSAPSLNLDYNDGIAVFTIDKEGLMAEVSVGGQKFDYKAIK